MVSLDGCPKPIGGVGRKDLGDEILFFDEGGDRIHVLNRTAREIYVLCDGAHSVRDVVEAMRKRFGEHPDPEEIDVDVRSTVEHLISLGVLSLD